jgi:hypothetical protein
VTANENRAFGSWQVLAAREDARPPGAVLLDRLIFRNDLQLEMEVIVNDVHA